MTDLASDQAASVRRWKGIAISSLAFAALLLVGVLLTQRQRLTDDRLLGTWQSDGPRTMADLRKLRTLTEKQLAVFENIYGKMKLTYTADKLTTDFMGQVTTERYDVLGKDKVSVAIREFKSQPQPIELSQFTVIQFDGSDAYYVETEAIREYFKRVK